MVCWHHARGGEGAKDLGEAVIKACQQPTQFKFLYPLDISIKVPASHMLASCLVRGLAMMAELTCSSSLGVSWSL